MAKLIAKTRIPYRGRMLQPGEEFDVTCVKTRRVLVACGKATIAGSPVPDVHPVVDRYVETEPVGPKKRRKRSSRKVTTTTTNEPPVQTYKRRDLTAEDV